ncbi:hypothetical protein SVAN01_10839 [Stagonosporopsis vannaccii]|nr:hypothetical protein SVAN01_10839 [Stagonosporopsis vannaccii]
MLLSPSFNDTEAASQQLLAEASSPVRRSPAAPVSASAVVGANLLNQARTLTKPPALKEKAGTLPKLRQLKPPQLRPDRLEKPGKLARASLSSLVSEALPKKVRGDKLYEIEPSPEKKRPHSLPSRAAALERDGFTEEFVMAEDNEMVPESSQARTEKDLSADSAGVQGRLAGDDQASEALVSPAAPVQKPGAGAKKLRGRPRKSGESTATASLPEAGTLEVQTLVAHNVHPEDVEIIHLPSSPPELPLQEEESAVPTNRRGRPRKSGESSTSTRLSEVDQPATHEKNEPPVPSPTIKRKARPGEKQRVDANAEAILQAPQARKKRRLNGPVMLSPDMPAFEEDLIAPRLASPRDAHVRNDLQPASGIPIRSTRSRTARAEAEVARAQEHSATAIITAVLASKAKPATRQARSTRMAKAALIPSSFKGKPSSSNPRSERGAARSEEHSDIVVEGISNKPTADHETLRRDQNDVASDIDVEGHEHHGEHVEEEEEDQEQQTNGQNNERHSEAAELQEEDQDDSAHIETATSANVEQTVNSDISRPSQLNRVFDFADSKERTGVCSTKLGRSIHRRCDRSRVILSRVEEDCSLDDIAKCKDGLIELLQSIHVRVQGEHRTAFKRDAFTYLFRDLIIVLEAVHDKLQEKNGDITRSLDSMQIVYPFIRELLRFKDTIDSWKVVVHQRTKGDRLIKGVESSLIAPLRITATEFGRHFRQLLKAETFHRAAVEAQRRHEEEEQEAIRIQEMIRLVRERRKRWQELHIVRMQCEPDPSRRRRLRFIEPVQTAETDANGRPFERVPFFGERSAPPPQWTAVSSGREWTSEQETALLDALQSSSGQFIRNEYLLCMSLTMHSTDLEHFFRILCAPSGALRDFSVSDIAAKMAWVRSGWAQLSHQHGWEVPIWVKNIPVLP